jgi:D-amino peptidase
VKVYISVDIEGVAGITHWDEATKNHDDYKVFQEFMTREALAACEGAIEAGASDILVKDAHDSGRNILGEMLPERARLIHGWSGHPFSMVQELDESFAAAMFIGYHARAGAEGNPLAHTMSTNLQIITINGEPASEFVLHSYAAATYGVPVVFLSGDERLCADSKAFNPGLSALAVKKGVGNSTISLSPAKARALIRQGAADALRRNLNQAKIALPSRFEVELTFNVPTKAYRASWYPGARSSGDNKVRLETDNFLDVMRMLKFVL